MVTNDICPVETWEGVVMEKQNNFLMFKQLSKRLVNAYDTDWRSNFVTKKWPIQFKNKQSKTKVQNIESCESFVMPMLWFVN